MYDQPMSAHRLYALNSRITASHAAACPAKRRVSPATPIKASSPIPQWIGAAVVSRPNKPIATP